MDCPSTPSGPRNPPMAPKWSGAASRIQCLGQRPPRPAQGSSQIPRKRLQRLGRRSRGNAPVQRSEHPPDARCRACLCVAPPPRALDSNLARTGGSPRGMPPSDGQPRLTSARCRYWPRTICVRDTRLLRRNGQAHRDQRECTVATAGPTDVRRARRRDEPPPPSTCRDPALDGRLETRPLHVRSSPGLPVDTTGTRARGAKSSVAQFLRRLLRPSPGPVGIGTPLDAGTGQPHCQRPARSSFFELQ